MSIRRLKRKSLAVLTVVCFALAGCNSSSSPQIPAATNISGDYSGTMTDSVGGAGAATASFAQHGANAGGAVTDVEGGGTITAQLSMTITSANTTSGSMVVDFSGGTTCTFGVSGAYSPSQNVLSGTYNAVTNCSGESGNFSLTQLCHDTVTNGVVHTFGTPKC